MEQMILEKVNPKALEICYVLEEHGYSAYIVGGAVRDLIMGREPKDWDIATSAKPQVVRNLFYKTIDTGLKHGTVTVMIDNEAFEVTTYRIDGNYSDSRHPDSVKFANMITEDLARRDFTINAMALSTKGTIIDPYYGQADIEKKRIWCVGNPADRFTEDALRMLRACRFAAQLGFEVDEYTLNIIRGFASSIKYVSEERIREELTKILVSDHPDVGLETAYDSSITKYVLPEFDRMMQCDHENPFHYTDVGHHCIDVVKGVPTRATLRWAALLHDVGKPDTKAWDESKGRFRYIGHPERSVEIATEILDRLKFSNADKGHILKLIQHHDFICETPSKLRRFAAEMGKDFFEDFYALQYADAYAHTADYAPYIQEKHDAMRKKIDGYFEDGSAIDVHGLKINGDDLIMIGLQGKQIGEFLNSMLNECLGQPSHNNKEYLVKQALKWAEKEIRKQKFEEHHQESNTDNR